MEGAWAVSVQANPWEAPIYRSDDVVKAPLERAQQETAHWVESRVVAPEGMAVVQVADVERMWAAYVHGEGHCEMCPCEEVVDCDTWEAELVDV